MDHRNFDYQNDGTFRRSAHNGTDGSFTLATEMECEQLIQANRRQREALAGAKDEVFRLAGSYPAPIVEKMMRDGSFHDDDAWRKLMNDPEMRAFRVWEGRI